MATRTAKAQIGTEHYKITITAGKNQIIADEGEDKGGKDLGFDPFQLFVSSLGACTCATVRMYADRKEMALDEINVDLIFEFDEDKVITNIQRNITFIGNLTDVDRERLLVVANKCPVHKIMSNPINIQTVTI
jgi:putative redox protein